LRDLHYGKPQWTQKQHASSVPRGLSSPSTSAEPSDRTDSGLSHLRECRSDRAAAPTLGCCLLADDAPLRQVARHPGPHPHRLLQCPADSTAWPS
jgi:hypothetical protein